MRSHAASPQQAFGTRIRELRQAQGLLQEDLAERCGVFRTYMSRIETGMANPTLTMIHALASSLDVPIAALFAEPDPDADKPQPLRSGRRPRD